MIPSLNLDNQSFKEIFEAMLARMPQYYAGDMDVSYQEPGVALLELFCLLKDMQQFYLNFVNDKHKLNYIKLLGGFPSNVGASLAETTLAFDGAGTLPEGLPVFAGDIQFETTEEIHLSDNKICAVASAHSGGIEGIPVWTSPFYPFGHGADRDNSLYIGFEKDISRHSAYGIYFGLENPMPDLTSPLGELQISFYSYREKWEIIYFDDKTNCFASSGKINFAIPRRMARAAIDGLELYWLRITLVKSWFELPPRLSGIYLNAVGARQTHTSVVSREYTVLPDNKIRLKTFLEQTGTIELQRITDGGLFDKFDEYIRKSPETIELSGDRRGERFLVLAWDKDCEMTLDELNGTPAQRVLCQNADGVQRIQVRREGGTAWEAWSRCEDLTAAGPLDKYFCVDGDAVCFGNDENGAIPPAGLARVTDCSVTSGVKGNVRSGAINRCVLDTAQVSNICPALGGRNAPAPEEVLRDIRRSLDTPGSAVTLEDYQQLVLNMPGLAIEQVKAVCDGNVTALYVKPKSVRRLPKLNEAYKENIRAYIEPFRILTTQVVIRSPEYYGVTVYADLVVERSVLDAERRVAEAVDTIVPSGAYTFAESLSCGAVYGLIQSLPFVKRIRRLRLECGGHTVKAGSYKIKQGGILYLEDIKLTLAAE